MYLSNCSSFQWLTEFCLQLNKTHSFECWRVIYEWICPLIIVQLWSFPTLVNGTSVIQNKNLETTLDVLLSLTPHIHSISNSCEVLIFKYIHSCLSPPLVQNRHHCHLHLGYWNTFLLCLPTFTLVPPYPPYIANVAIWVRHLEEKYQMTPPLGRQCHTLTSFYSLFVWNLFQARPSISWIKHKLEKLYVF